MPVVLRAITMLLLLAILPGCATPTQTAPSAPAPDAVSGTQVVSIEAMEPAEKRSLIAPSFPLEAPVPSGAIVRGQAQGEDAWDYEVVVSAPPAALADWYRNAYTSRSWQIVDDVALSEAGGEPVEGYELTMVKGDAQSLVSILADAGGARATVVFGLGVPVLEPQ